MQVSELNIRPVLPPGQFTISISIKVSEASIDSLLWDVSILVVTLDHHVILFIPRIVGHNTIVRDSLSDVACALGIVPESADEFVVVVILLLLLLLDDSIEVCVTNEELVGHVVLKAHVVVNDVVKSVQHGQGKLQVFPSVANGVARLISSRSRLGAAFHVVEYLVLHRIERRQRALQVDWTVLGAIVLKNLFKTDRAVVIEVHQLVESDDFGAVAACVQANVSDKGLELFESNFVVLWARVQIVEDLFTLDDIVRCALIWNWLLGCACLGSGKLGSIDGSSGKSKFVHVCFDLVCSCSFFNYNLAV